MPAKKLSVSFQRALIKEMLAHYPVQIILLGGREDTLRNQAIGAGLPVIQSSTDKGIKDGLISIAACDVVITGDSLGMHLAIAMEKFVVAWFGPSCAHEIELYGRGKKILTKAPCSPCWKRSCQKPSMCYDQVDAAEILAAVSEGLLECSRPLEIPQIQSPILPTPSI
ncbi:MAG: glycosyltransferase family 9 protein [Bdellovibrionota bacterium]